MYDGRWVCPPSDFIALCWINAAHMKDMIWQDHFLKEVCIYSSFLTGMHCVQQKSRACNIVKSQTIGDVSVPLLSPFCSSLIPHYLLMRGLVCILRYSYDAHCVLTKDTSIYVCIIWRLSWICSLIFHNVWTLAECGWWLHHPWSLIAEWARQGCSIFTNGVIKSVHISYNRMFQKCFCYIGEARSTSETVILLPFHDLVYCLSDIKSLFFDTPGILVLVSGFFWGGGGGNNWVITWDVTFYHRVICFWHFESNTSQTSRCLWMKEGACYFTRFGHNYQWHHITSQKIEILYLTAVITSEFSGVNPFVGKFLFLYKI